MAKRARVGYRLWQIRTYPVLRSLLKVGKLNMARHFPHRYLLTVRECAAVALTTCLQSRFPLRCQVRFTRLTSAGRARSQPRFTRPVLALNVAYLVASSLGDDAGMAGHYPPQGVSPLMRCGAGSFPTRSLALSLCSLPRPALNNGKLLSSRCTIHCFTGQVAWRYPSHRRPPLPRCLPCNR